ncbi:polysaccharide biosynthesis protein [Paeniglutamicibacter cryotolerans]|uniref:FlaA1/EpsC-like NDP-sugar epimerase n=1 Tax=Paeniglutamicibacter cryotolerans TaxID=670079 RepID=A0A839QQV9_9MICC|nr:nucleoside-diphosphate sugar epimerase/dehydratase [Paeniglutamicibacter cryotolerans]MBB2996376.1 FlaA1/EpsC-like NDP-sugar epimerase [Paeniglutamicibacter cryotolerans]
MNNSTRSTESGAKAPAQTSEKKPAIWLWSQAILDSFAWAVALLLAVLLRYELDVRLINAPGLTVLILVAIATQLIAGWMLSLYRGAYSFGSIQEARVLIVATVIVSAVVFCVSFIFINELHVARSISAIAFPFAALFMAAVRYAKRLYVEGKPVFGDEAQKTLIYGAGFLGNSLVTRMVQDPVSPYVPVGLVDDDQSKKHLRLSSVPVIGRGDELPELIKRTKATVIVLAMADVDAEQVRRISDSVSGLGVKVLILPPLQEMLTVNSENDNHRGGLTDFREIDVEDLIGRRPVDIHVEQIAGYITGKRVLVTGAGGSIGSELCRQLHGFDPAELIMLDRDESGLQHTQFSIFGHGLLNDETTVLADIRDSESLLRIFEQRRPEVVFHAAALKHAPLLQQYPSEAWQTNVLGSLNVLNAARSVDVETFVNVSTDKAASPTTALGHSKRAAEKLTAWMAEATARAYVSVRFGNVIGSRGSMLPLFTDQINKGGPVTVTHPDVTRFFMTIPEACQLVIQAGAIGDGGDVLILDMGEPVRILDVAKRMIQMSGRKIEITFTGLRPSEKLHEQLVGDDEKKDIDLHPKISHTRARSLSPEALDFELWLRRCREEAGESNPSIDDSDGDVAAGA